MEHNAIALENFTDDELTILAEGIRIEQSKRALERNDISELVEMGFENGFTARGEAITPWIHNGVLICPGHKIGTSKFSHRCKFVTIEKEWAWQSPLRFNESLRKETEFKLRSITIVPVVEGMEISVIISTAQNELHTVRDSEHYTIEMGELVRTSQSVVDVVIPPGIK